MKVRGFGASPTPGCARWKKRGDTLCARRRVMGFCARGPRLGIPPCAKTAGTFRTRNALQVAVGQYDCGRCAAQKHTFRKRVGHLPQKQRISAGKRPQTSRKQRRTAFRREKPSERSVFRIEPGVKCDILFSGTGFRAASCGASCPWHKHGGRKPVNEEASFRRRQSHAAVQAEHAAPSVSGAA